jgi:hypothetical protein
MAGTFRPLDEPELRSLLEQRMGYHQVIPRGTSELTWERSIPRSKYAVRIYSSIVSGVTRDRGQDAIRVCLVDLTTDRVVRSQRVNRTDQALRHMRERAGEMWRWCLQQREVKAA